MVVSAERNRASNAANAALFVSRQINVSFDSSAAFVDHFRRQHGRLPQAAEFNAWTARLVQHLETGPEGQGPPPTIRDVRYQTGNFPHTVLTQFGPPASDSYLLTVRSGDERAYYAAWAKRSTLNLDPDNSYISRKAKAGRFVFALLTFLLGGAAFLVWPRRYHPENYPLRYARLESSASAQS